MKKISLKNFYNEGFGWICRRCGQDSENRKETSRLMTEGEDESRNSELSSKGLAKWLDEGRKILICPVCKTKESAGKASQ